MNDKTIPHPKAFVEQARLELIKGYRVHEMRTPSKPLRVITPSQTIGPFFHLGLVREGDDDVACMVPGGARAQGTPIVVTVTAGRMPRRSLGPTGGPWPLRGPLVAP